MAVAVLRDGKPVSVRTLGVANIELNVPVTRDTVFKIGSVSKQFIATGIMLLVRDGKVGLDDSLAKYFDDAPEAWKPITVRQLLSHTSGLVRESPGFDGLKAQSDFKPLGMTATRTTDTLDIVPHRANGYLFRDNEQHNVGPLLALRPSGAFLSTITDLMKWETALHDGVVLTKEEQAQMFTPVKLTDGSATQYGFGWMVDDVRGHHRVHHGGTLPGFRAEFSRHDDGLGVIVLVNADSARTDAIAVEVANHYISGLSPDRPTIKLPAATLAEYAGRYRLDGDNFVTVGVDGPGLSVQFSQGGPQSRVLPENPTTFFMIKDESLVFAREGTQVKSLTIRGPGREMVAEKVY